jgi:integrase
MSIFMYALKAPDTKRQYPRRFQYFLIFLDITGNLEEQANTFVSRATENLIWAQESLMSFVDYEKERVRKDEIAESTITNYYKATKLFCVMNDIALNWKKISRGLPSGKRASNDRALTIEEVRKLCEYPDRRIKSIIYIMISSGIRIGAFDYLQWKDVQPIDIDGEIIAAKLRVYSGDREEYYCFITPEAYASLKDWMDFRASYGEKITGQSWVMRDLWQTTNIKYGAKLGLATCPKKLKSSGVKRIIERAIWEQGLRRPLVDGAKRHDWKAAHGFRKFYKSRAEQAMKPINVELTMGHDIGVSASYYKPTEREVLEDYRLAIPLLSISSGSTNNLLQKEVEKLTEKTIKAKLLDKENSIQKMKEKYDADIALLKDALLDIQQLLKNPEKLTELSIIEASQKHN